MTDKELMELYKNSSEISPRAELKQQILEKATNELISKNAVKRSIPAQNLIVWKRFVPIAACFMFVFLSVIGMIGLNNENYQTVYIDVNPSVALAVNRFGKVSGVEYINDDAKNALEGIKIKGKRAEKALPSLLKNIESRQLSNGGFAYWPGKSEAHDWATSMVGEVLTEARRQGFAVSSQCYDRWKEYQNSVARRYRHSTTNAADLMQAYRLYTLVLAGEQPTAAMNKLRESKSISQQALLRLAAAYALAGREDVAEKLIEKSNSTKTVNGSYATFWSPLRDKAMALEAWLIAGDKTKAFKLAKEVADEFSATLSSTQEVAFVSIAMSRMGDVVGNSVPQIAISDGNGAGRVIRNLKGVQQFALSTAQGFIEVENQGDEEVSLSLMLSRTPSANEDVKPIANGVDIDVQYADLKGNAITIDKLQQGEEFLAKIRVKKTNDSSPSMALTYAIPSGWEIWNERLTGGEESQGATYTDIRDSSISWYFAIEQGQTKEFVVRLRAAYGGQFILPPTICEDMYNPSCRANTTNGLTIVVR